MSGFLKGKIRRACAAPWSDPWSLGGPRILSSLLLGVLLAGFPDAARAEDWQIAGYYPQYVKAGDAAAGGVTLNGTFSTYQEGRKVKLGRGSNVVTDLTPHVIVWTQGQVRVLVPSGVPQGLHWLAVYTSGDELLAKGPETLVVTGVVDLATDPGSKTKPQLKAGAVKGLVTKPAELEIQNMTGLPAQICPGRSYNVSVTVVNHGDWQAMFHLCSVGSLVGGCMGGQPPVHEIGGKSTKTLSMVLTPAAPFIENGKWHGKVFLGKVESPSANTQISVQGEEGKAAGPSDCNVGVSTSWTEAPGMSAGTLFCDKNMDNHLVKLAVDSPTLLCGKGLKEKAIKGPTSTGTAPGSDSWFDVYMDVTKPRRESDPKRLVSAEPKLSVKSIAVHPAPLKAGTPVNLEIAFENKGNKASAPDAKYKLACAVLHGGPECPAPSGDKTIGKSIEPGQTGSVLLMGAKPAVAGEYLVSVAVPPDQMGRPYSVTLKVAPVVTGPRTQPPDKPPQVRPASPSQPKSEDGKPRLVPR